MDLHHLLLAGLPAHSGSPLKADIAQYGQHLSKVPIVLQKSQTTLRDETSDNRRSICPQKMALVPTLAAILFRLWRCRRRRYLGTATGRCRCHWRLTLGPFASDFAARPGKIVGATGRRRQRLTFDQDPRR